MAAMKTLAFQMGKERNVNEQIVFILNCGKGDKK